MLCRSRENLVQGSDLTQSRKAAKPQSRKVAKPQSRKVAKSQSRKVAKSQSRKANVVRARVSTGKLKPPLLSLA